MDSPQTSITIADVATTKLYVVYYSLYRHVEIMAREVQRGANSVQGVEATIWQVPETLSDTILQKMKAPAKAADVPVIRPEQLLDADGFLFGLKVPPTVRHNFKHQLKVLHTQPDGYQFPQGNFSGEKLL